MKTGILYWITGLSGAGKTTIGNRLYYSIKKQDSNIIILDGDVLKNIAGSDTGYTKDDRLKRAYRYCELCKVLTDQGINVIICTIAMFDEVRNWNRDNIERYVEVFVDVPIEILEQRNQKGLYSSKNNQVVGIDVSVEYPKNPDIVIKNIDSSKIEQSVRTIMDFEVKSIQRFNRDERYWNNYYDMDIAPCEPSLFAVEMYNKYMQPNCKLIELGCGNGRDSIFFAQKGIDVTGIDNSEAAINKINRENRFSNCIFVCDDFVNAQAIYQTQYNYCYSRFTLHAISLSQENIVLMKAYNMLKKGGYFMIEARSINDKKYGLGNKVENNAFIFEGHYRRFLELDELVKKLEMIGFKIIESGESDKFAPNKENDTVCLRIIAQK